jgi:hypothetical protein
MEFTKDETDSDQNGAVDSLSTETRRSLAVVVLAPSIA